MTSSTEIKCLIVGCGKVLTTTKSSQTPAINHLSSKKHNYTKKFIERIDTRQANLQNIIKPKQIDQVDVGLERKILRLVCLKNFSMNKISSDLDLRDLLQAKHCQEIQKSHTTISSIVFRQANLIKYEIRKILKEHLGDCVV